MAMDYRELTELHRQEALRCLENLKVELLAAPELLNPSLNYMSEIRFRVAEPLRDMVNLMADANRHERDWVTSPLNRNAQKGLSA